MTKLLYSLLFLAISSSFVVSQDNNCTCTNPLHVATFNTLQIVFAPYKQERLNAQISYLANSSFDILCLQELWNTTERDQLLQGVKSAYPYSISPPPKNATCNADCTGAELDRLVKCAGSFFCLEQESFLDQLRCIRDNCDDLFDDISDQCERCIVLEGGLSFNERLVECAGQQEVSPGVTTGCQYLFGGESDTLLLSRTNFTKTDYRYFNVSPIVAIAVVYGQVEINGATVHAFCNHLSSDLPFVNNQQENKLQFEQLVQYVRETVPANESNLVLVLGDFNASPEIPSENIEGNWPDNLAVMEANGYTNLYVNLSTGPLNCTYCGDNPLVSPVGEGEEDEVDTIIDHIFANHVSNVSDGYCVANVSLFGTQNNVQVSEETVPLSDHYGVETYICLNTTVRTVQRNFAAEESVGTVYAISMSLLLFVFPLLW